MNVPAFDPIDITTFCNNDISAHLVDAARQTKLVAWDIETTGLDWEHDSIALCQIYVPGVAIEVVRPSDDRPERLCGLLSDDSVRKVFHHALFDLRFMTSHWQVIPANIACTKIASKLLFPAAESHSLKPLLAQELGVDVSKDLATSDWTNEDLSPEQIRYAATDVYFLPDLVSHLEKRLSQTGMLGLAQRCFEHIPTRTELDVLRFPDVYTY